ncbi:acriflavin resistance protein [Psychrosphaera saromensis]|uniref:Acriflavine resistance protein B n=1 Tax=Psychrosphaera saromensis TaxID=716813 RepID=A0A2S7UU74_9GAMM|nr:efflux RND transporter permease subunit [Psychrosphaera saromensis]PQJ53493.1 acriflavine resistance protein B [Psychrosphaera saromensis]GHB65030.1 acriflavin resistance protein [Psychrosphaera saromensis]GLQ14711.1 acriflavin resistance protein [Psychrosphaera saromensis]
MIAWFTKNHVAANLLLITILLAGIFSLTNRIPLEVFPSFESDVVSVKVSLRGATPEDVEQGVSIRVEEAVQDLEGIERITSRSSEGSASISIEIESGYEPRDMLADIKSRVDAINTFPADAENPVVGLNQRIREVLTVTIAGDYSEAEIREYAELIRDDMLRIPGITQLELTGVRNYEITISVDQDKLRQYDLTLSEVSQSVGNSSLDISAGNLRSSGGDILLRSKGQAYHKDEFASIVVKNNSDGSIIHLEDVATINDGFEEYPIRTRFNGKQAVFIDVYRIGQQSAIDVADKVKEYIVEQQNNLPQGYELSYWDDNSQVVKNRLSTLTSSAIQGGILVLLLLTLFLRPAIAFWVFIGIPISFMGAFIVMPFFGITLNIMSLFGFILVLGIVVDDAIVTGENVYTHMRHSKSSEEAAIKGTQEVATPVTFGVLTTVVAFLPLAFIEGNRGALFAQLPVVIIPVLIFSLIESKFVLPAHLKYIKYRHESELTGFAKFQRNFADGFERSIIKYYQPVLKKALSNKGTTISMFVGAFILVVSLIMSGWTKFVFFPRIPSETISMNLSMPTGTPFEVTDKFIRKISGAATELQEKYVDEDGQSIVLNTLAITGGRGGTTHQGLVRFEIIPPEQRESTITSSQLLTEWRGLIGTIPGAETITFRAEIGRSSDPIDVQLSATSIKTLQEVAEKVKERLATYPTVFDIADSMSNGKQELQIELTKQGEALGLTRNSITQQIRTAYYGSEVQRIQRGRDDVRVLVRLPLEEREAISNLEHILITTPSGGQVPLSHVAQLIPGQSPSTISRIDRYRVLNVTADIDKTDTNMTALNADLKVYLDDLVAKYPGVSHSLEGEAKEQRESFGSLQWGLLLVFFAIYCLLAIPFKSYWQPVAVMSVIPFGILGAVVGHWIMGMDLTIMSILGMLALVGVVVNDSLVLVDYINKKRSEGMALLDAVSTAGAARFRPVMLTSLTTFIGLLPLLFEESTQAQFLIPMGVSLGFGILFATFITLILVPVNYMLLDKLVAYKPAT